jgi:hypothetical protein
MPTQGEDRPTRAAIDDAVAMAGAVVDDPRSFKIIVIILKAGEASQLIITVAKRSQIIIDNEMWWRETITTTQCVDSGFHQIVEFRQSDQSLT